MRLPTVKRSLCLWATALLLPACGPEAADDNFVNEDEATNPFLALEKADTAYLNPSGIEVEVDLEADIVTTSTYRIKEGPAEIGQFALTYLRKRGDFYLESLAEDSSSADRVEWKVGTTWKTARQVTSTTGLKRFRIRGVNAVLLNRARTGVTVGKVFTAVVPLDPFNVYSKAGSACADPDDHMSLDQSVYWYMWNPDRSGCKTKITVQTMNVTVSKIVAKPTTVYPEYDQLVADKKVTAVVLFGQIDDGAITDYEPGMIAMREMAANLLGAKYTEVKPAPVGRRFTKKFGTTTMEIDLYSPRDFAGLGDSAHFSNLQKAISEHEIIAYDGHSMLGASDFWERPTYPSFYQIFLYGGCLGYEYYVRPIVEGKNGWGKLDLMSAVVEVTANANEFAAPVLAKVTYALTHQYNQSWQKILSAVRTSVGDSTFGVSGVRDNCFTPTGSRCR